MTNQTAPTSSIAPAAAAQTFPFATVEDLSQFFLFKLLNEAQQQEVLSLQDRAERHHKFAELLRANGYLQPAAN